MAFTLEQLNALNHGTLMETLGIAYTDFSQDTLTATMPVTPRVHQPFGLLHGGATAALVESVAGCLSNLVINLDQQAAVGTHINVYHLKSIKDGEVKAVGTFIKKGKRIHTIRIDIFSPKDELLAYGIMTNHIISKPSAE